MRILFLISALLMSIVCTVAQIQTIDDVSKQILPPSPQAASLGKYGETPVNFHTGGVTVSLPLYEVKIGSLTLPLTLSYQTSGVRVTDVASRVGLGWTLQGEGVITRTVRGLPDEESLGYAYTAGLLSYTDLTSTLDSVQYWAADMIAMGQLDSEPDVYNYNFLGHSGKFYHHPTSGIVKMPHNNLVISPEWTIIGDDGTKYFFSEPETTTSYTSTNIPSSYVSSWYLTRILTVKGDEIIFNYEENPSEIQHGFILSETDYYAVSGGSKPLTRTLSNMHIGGVRLESIETRIEKIEFLYDETENGGDGRLDLNGDYRLKKIRVISKLTNESFKELEFVHHYSFSTQDCIVPDYPSFPNPDNNRYRLMLDAIVDRSPDSTAVRQHTFIYNPALLPARCSFDQDHWGYYNAKANTTLLPRISFFPPSYPKGNRAVNPTVTGAQSLTQITYPTGGFTAFEFEPHKLYGEVTFDTLLSKVVTITNANMGVFDDEVFSVNQSQLVEIHINYDFAIYDGTGASVQLISGGTPVHQVSLNAVDLLTDGGIRVTPPIALTSGTYTLKVINSSDGDGVSIAASLDYYNLVTENRNSYYGGQRIKSISDYTDTGVLATKRIITYEDIQVLSPVTETNYHYFQSETQFSSCIEGGGGHSPVTHNYSVRTSGNNFTGATSQGSHVAYGKVNVTRLGPANGKTVYEYTTTPDLDAGAYFPFPPPTSLEHRRGLLTREAHYDAEDVLVKETLNTYAFDSIATIGAFKVGYTYNSLCFDWGNGGMSVDEHAYGITRMISEWVKQTSTEEKIYPGPVANKTDMFYDNVNHLQVTRKERARTDGKYDLEYFLFPDDFASGTAFIDSLRLRNVKTAVVEQVTAISDSNGSNKKIIGGKINQYSTTKAGLLTEIKFLELEDLLALGSFKFANRATGNLPTQGSATTFAPHSTYTGNVFFDGYDAYGNVTQFHTNQGLNVSLKWAYNQARPTVMTKNALPTEIFYEGFEEYEGASVTTPYAGKGYKTGSYTATFTRPNSRSYTLSYWKLVSGTWELVTTPLSSDNPVINPGVPIDDVFIYPSDVEFRLMNYDPSTFLLANETNQTHTINYFLFDKLQRLELIRDHNQDIVSEFIYHYKTND